MNESSKVAATIPPPPPTIVEEKRSWADWVTGVGGPLIGLVLLCVIFSLTTDVFLTWRNALNVIDQITVLGILAIGMTAVIVIGGIDLSVGSILAFSMMMMGWLYQSIGVPLGLAIVAGILVGAACGLVDGPHHQSEAAAVHCDVDNDVGWPAVGQHHHRRPPNRRICDWSTNLSTVRHFGFLSVTVAVFIVLSIISWAILRYTTIGRSLYAIGGSPEVARLAGIRVRQLTMSVYALVGVIGGIGVGRPGLQTQFLPAERWNRLRARYNRCGGHRRRELERRRRRNPRNRRRRPDYRRSPQRIELERRLALRSTNRNRRRHRIGGGRGHASQA